MAASLLLPCPVVTVPGMQSAPAGQSRADLNPPGQRPADQPVVPGSVRLLLDLCGEGVTLTSGGRLPRAVVRQVQLQRPQWGWAQDQPARIEEDLLPLAMLHELLRKAHLLRLAHGVLTTTKAAASDAEVVRRLRAGLFDRSFHGQLCHLLLDTLSNIDEVAEAVLVDAALLRLAPEWRRQDRPLEHLDVRVAVGRAHHDLIGLDAITTSGSLLRDSWSITAEGRALLPA